MAEQKKADTTNSSKQLADILNSVKIKVREIPEIHTTSEGRQYVNVRDVFLSGSFDRNLDKMSRISIQINKARGSAR